MVRQVRSCEELNEILREAGDKLVVVDFTATWCGPCKMISPVFVSLSETYSDVVFLKVDVDEASDVSEECKIQSVPTFLFYKNGKKVDEFSGANKVKLEETLKRHL